MVATKLSCGRTTELAQAPKRFHRHFILGLLALSCTACNSSAPVFPSTEAEARQQAHILLQKAVLNHSPQDRIIWGMTDIRVFGPIFLFDESNKPWGGAPNASGRSTKSRRVAADSPESDTIEVTIPFWCQGASLKGESLKLKRVITMTVHRPRLHHSWILQKYELADEGDLTFSDQLATWISLNFLVVLVLLFYIFACCLYGWKIAEFLFCFRFTAALLELVLRLGGIIALFFVIGFSGLSAYHCFGSALAVVLAIPGYVMLVLLIAALFAALFKSRNKVRLRPK